MSDKASPPAKEPTPTAPEGETPAESKPTSAKDTKPASKKSAKPSKGRPSAGGASKKAASGSKDATVSSYSVGDIILARLKGYPPWPARVADPEKVPTNVAKRRPGTSSNVYCCQFFPVGDFSWLNAKELSPLSPSDIKSYTGSGHRKSGDLMEAYKTAEDPTEWLEQQEQIKNAAETEAGDVDELADEDEEAASGSKRKRAETSKQTKSKKKSKADAGPESEEEAPKSKSRKQTATKGGGPSKKGRTSEAKPAPVEEKPAADEDPMASDPACVKVKDWRHRLQRAFLGKGLPADDEMGTYDALFKTIEEYQEITIAALQYSKIGKVMKKIATLEGIPRNDELRITDRAAKLMNVWSDFISQNEKTNGNANGNGNGESGEKKEANGEESKMEVEA